MARVNDLALQTLLQTFEKQVQAARYVVRCSGNQSAFNSHRLSAKL